MSDTLGEKFNFYYLADTMVTDGLFVDNAKDKIVEDIINKQEKWYVKQIHDKVTDGKYYINNSRVDKCYWESG